MPSDWSEPDIIETIVEDGDVDNQIKTMDLSSFFQN